MELENNMKVLDLNYMIEKGMKLKVHILEIICIMR